VSHWQEVSLGDVVSKSDTWNPRSYPNQSFEYIDLSSVSNQSKSIVSTTPYSGAKAPSRARQLVKNGDIIVATVRPNLNSVAQISQEHDGATVSTGFTVLRPTHEIDSDFLFFHTQTGEFVNALVNKASGASYPAVTDRNVKETILALPPMSEQRRIARALRNVREALMIQREAEAKARELKAAVMEQVFTRGLHNEPLKETEIGPIPESWELVTFSEAVVITQGPVDPRNPPYNKMLHLGPANIESGTGIVSGCQASEELGLISGKFLFEPGQIVYSKIRPHLNKVARPSFGGLCSADMYPLKTQTGFTESYLFQFLLSSRFVEQATKSQLRAAMPKINRKELSFIKVPKPPIECQEIIGEILGTLDRKIVSTRSKIKLLDELFQRLLHDLMTGAARVDDNGRVVYISAGDAE